MGRTLAESGRRQTINNVMNPHWDDADCMIPSTKYEGTEDFGSDIIWCYVIFWQYHLDSTRLSFDVKLSSPQRKMENNYKTTQMVEHTLFRQRKCFSCNMKLVRLKRMYGAVQISELRALGPKNHHTRAVFRVIFYKLLVHYSRRMRGIVSAILW